MTRQESGRLSETLFSFIVVGGFVASIAIPTFFVYAAIHFISKWW